MVGSRAYGLDRPDSDYDYREVFYIPTEELTVNIHEIKSQWGSEHKHTDDIAGWEVAHWWNMVEHGSPNAVELIWAPTQDGWSPNTFHEGAVSKDVLSIAEDLLTVEATARATLGYAKNSFRKVEDRPTKWLTGYLRSLIMGLELLQTGQMTMPMNHANRNLLREIMSGGFTAGSVMDIGHLYEENIKHIQRTPEVSPLRESVDWDDLWPRMVEVRQSLWTQ